MATAELTAQGRRVAVVEQENRANLGGQAPWSFGGMFLVDSPEQRRLRVHDSLELAWGDWCASTPWDRLDGAHLEDEWCRAWGRAYVEWAAGANGSGCGRTASSSPPWSGGPSEVTDVRGHGNSVPRFYIAWGTGTDVSGPFVAKALQAERDGLVTFFHRHRVDYLVLGSVLADDDAARGIASNRDVVGRSSCRRRPSSWRAGVSVAIMTLCGGGGRATSGRRRFR